MEQLYAGINNRNEEDGQSYASPAIILSQTKGEFLIVCPDDSDKFYFLCKMDCDLLVTCETVGWMIVYHQVFNKDLVIGMGLADPNLSHISIFRTKDEDTCDIWHSILEFVFLKGLINYDYFTYETSFTGHDVIHDIEYHYIHDYYPLFCKNVSKQARQARNCVYAFKDGEKPWLWAKVFALCISKLPCFASIKDNAVLVPIPASSKKSHNMSFSRFCRNLAERLDVADGFRTLWIEYDRDEMKGTVGENKIENLTFNRKYIQGKHVLLIDDVITTGASLVQIGKKLLELGAISVRGVFMARTIREAELS